MQAAALTKDTIVRFETTEAVRIKALLERMMLYKDLCWRFSPSGITSNATNTNIVFALLNLPAEKLNTYHCTHEVVVGIEVGWWFNIFKKVNQDDTIIIRITESCYNGITPEVELFIWNPETEMMTERRIPVLNIQMEELEIPDKEFEAVVSIPAHQFLRALKHCDNTGAGIRIYTADNHGDGARLHLQTTGDIRGSARITLRVDVRSSSDAVRELVDGAEQVAKKARTELPICNKRETYSINQLLEIAKSMSMNPTASVVIYLTSTQGYPLVLDYLVGTMGSLKYIIAPRIDDDEEDVEQAALTTKMVDMPAGKMVVHDDEDEQEGCASKEEDDDVVEEFDYESGGDDETGFD